jgi:hypothetical protein
LGKNADKTQIVAKVLFEIHMLGWSVCVKAISRNNFTGESL